MKWNQVVVNTDDETDTLIVCAESELDPTTYIHPAKKVRVKVDHLAHTFAVLVGKPLPPTAFAADLEGKRKALQTALAEYVARFNSPSAATSSAGVYSSPDGKITAVLSGQRLNLSNCWSGAWDSKWVVTSSAVEKGDIRARAHYFEEGNMQLNTNKAVKDVAVAGADDTAWAASVVKQIQGAEDETHKALEGMYLSMGEGMLKGMRRVMPVTRSKMEWNLGSIGVVKGLATKK